ncbi:Hsp33 family molecular chaperone HslO [Asaia krungthepensis]|uniref:Heat shock protein Hsp33 n=1 Tax=Asaia krungthepensis NRIC 0535 TaxID=1307925 RepID=A0ABQ0Q2H9_9PROT|nr:Hsp33 family molecular chaperone HslO [Asaia krungthepensis]GBQ88237.1 heat shock protein Hsp33 [Asaia krungthepensis NRIC 0535]
MIETPAFLDTHRPETVPDLVISHGITPFHLARRPVRGRLIRLGKLADIMVSRHDIPDCGRQLAGEALSLVAGLSAGLKFKGSFSLQIKGDGPISMLVADCTDAGELRFYLRAPESLDPAPAKALLGEGYFAFTIDQGAHTERHQGIVALEGETLADMAMHYFATSEQHQCWMRLYCEKTPDGWRAGALLLEKIAEEGGIVADKTDDEDAWETAGILGNTLTAAEIFDPHLSATTLIERLFGSQDVLIDRPRAVSLGCRCNRARLASVLSTFPEDDLDHMAEGGTITMNCEFCNVGFRFERTEIAR